MPNVLLRSELGNAVTRMGMRFFVHVVLLPREDGNNLCATSRRLAAQAPEDDVYYVLPFPTGDGLPDWPHIIRAVIQGCPPVMPKTVSYPHITLLHVWMEEPSAAALLDNFSRTAHHISIPEIRVDDWIARASPRWSGGELLSTAVDYGCSAIVAKTEQLLQVQEQAQSLIPTGSNSRVVTGIGDLWKPHVTLLALQGDHRPSFREPNGRKLVIEDPILAVGLSGLYGQFKTALAIAGADIEPTPVGKSAPRLKDILDRAPA